MKDYAVSMTEPMTFVYGVEAETPEEAFTLAKARLQATYAAINTTVERVRGDGESFYAIEEEGGKEIEVGWNFDEGVDPDVLVLDHEVKS